MFVSRDVVVLILPGTSKLARFLFHFGVFARSLDGVATLLKAALSAAIWAASSVIKVPVLVLGNFCGVLLFVLAAVKQTLMRTGKPGVVFG